MAPTYPPFPRNCPLAALSCVDACAVEQVVDDLDQLLHHRIWGSCSHVGAEKRAVSMFPCVLHDEHLRKPASQQSSALRARKLRGPRLDP